MTLLMDEALSRRCLASPRSARSRSDGAKRLRIADSLKKFIHRVTAKRIIVIIGGISFEAEYFPRFFVAKEFMKNMLAKSTPAFGKALFHIIKIRWR